jgi:hypothetical protein
MNRIQMGILFFFTAIACLLLFVLGWKGSRRAGFRTRLAVAVSILGLMFSEAFAQENTPPVKPQQGQNDGQADETAVVVSEITGTREFRGLKKIWRSMQKALKIADEPGDNSNRDAILKSLPTESFETWKANLEKSIAAGGAEGATAEQKILAARAEYFKLLADVTVSVIRHRKAYGMMCYAPSPLKPKGVHNKDVQARLLEQQVKDGKVSEETAAKVKRAMNNLYDRTLFPDRELSEKDAIRLSRLLAELNAGEVVDVTKPGTETEYRRACRPTRRERFCRPGGRLEGVA